VINHSIHNDYHSQFHTHPQQGNENQAKEKSSTRQEPSKMENLRQEWQRSSSHSNCQGPGMEVHHLGSLMTSFPKTNLFQFIVQRCQSASALQAASSDACRQLVTIASNKLSTVQGYYLKVTETSNSDSDPQEQDQQHNQPGKKAAIEMKKKLFIQKILQHLQLSYQLAEDTPFNRKTSVGLSNEDFDDVHALFHNQFG
jgi:hypothetical protein